EVTGALEGRANDVVSHEALELVADMHREFEPRRRSLLRYRDERQRRISAGELPDFLAATQKIRADEWTVKPVPDDIQDRRVEITGPTDRKMVINALNSGARVFMADFEDSNTPTWSNLVEGQVN